MKQRLLDQFASFNALPPVRRYCLLTGWLLVLGLALVLLLRPLFAAWQDAQQWRTLAQQAQRLGAPVALSNEQWQALAISGQFVLTQVEHQDGVWQVQGEVPRPETLTQLMRTLQEQGARPVRWRLERGARQYVFSLDVATAAVAP